MDVFDDEVLGLWRTMEKNGVLYIMVGDFAINMTGFNRFTADIDIWIKDSKANRKNLIKALMEIGLGELKGLETSQLIPGWTNITMESGMELDFMTELAGFKESDFDECYKLAPIAEIYNLQIRFLHLNHLIRNKKAAGRSKDLIDVIELEKIKREQDNT